MTDRIRIGLIGLGNVSIAHVYAYLDDDAIDIVSGCDTRKEAVDAFVERTGAKEYPDAESLLTGGDIDIALVLTPAVTHRFVVESAASAGVHVLCEKPIATTVEDGEAMLRACEDAGVQFFYGSCYRFLPAVVKARELIRDGAIGKVQLLSERLVGGSGLESYAEMGFAHYPRGTPGGPGMGLVDHGIHLIDIFPWLTGSEIRSASGSGTLSGAGPTVEHAVLTMATGAIGHLLYYSATYYTELPTEGRFNEGKGWNLDGTLTSSGQWDAHPGSISVYGDQGALRIFQYANALFFSDRSGLQQIALEGRPPPGHFAAQLRECARCIRTGEDPTVDGRAGIRALQTLMEIYGE